MLKLQSELFECPNYIWNLWTSFGVLMGETRFYDSKLNGFCFSLFFNFSFDLVSVHKF